MPANPSVWARGRILPLRAPFATTVWDYINRGMPLNREGTLTPDEVYALTAYLLFINGVIPEDQVLDQQNLAKVKMPLGDNYASTPRLEAADAKAEGLPLLDLLARLVRSRWPDRPPACTPCSRCHYSVFILLFHFRPSAADNVARLRDDSVDVSPVGAD